MVPVILPVFKGASLFCLEFAGNHFCQIYNPTKQKE